MYFQYLYIIYKHSNIAQILKLLIVYLQYITTILTNHKTTESLSGRQQLSSLS